MPSPSEHIGWIRYELNGALTTLTAVSPSAELAHRRLSEYHWQTGEWPSERGGAAAALCRVRGKAWARAFSQLTTLGWRSVRGRLFHSEVHRVRAYAVASLRSAQASGRMGAERRWTGKTAQAAESGPDGPPIGTLCGPDGPPMGTRWGPDGDPMGCLIGTPMPP